MEEILWIVSSSMTYGECFTIHGVFSTEALADAYIANRKTSVLGIFYYKDPFMVDDPDVAFD